MTSDWATSWRAALGRDPTSRRRLEQGLAWVRGGRVSGLTSTPGLVAGRVQGDEATPYVVTIPLAEWDDDAWERVTELIGGRARHHADLLAGIAPAELADSLDDVGLALLPAPEELGADRLGPACRCDDPSAPCLHVAAVWEAAAEAIAADPFWLLRLRGRGRERLLAALSARRRSDADVAMPIDDLDVRAWTTPSTDVDRLALPIPRRREADASGLLRLLGDPPGWQGRVDVTTLLGPVLDAAAARAGQQVSEVADHADEGGRDDGG